MFLKPHAQRTPTKHSYVTFVLGELIFVDFGEVLSFTSDHAQNRPLSQFSNITTFLFVDRWNGENQLNTCIFSGATNLPAGYGNTESSTKDHYFNPFDIHNNKISDRKEQQETAVAETDGVAKLTDSKQEDGKRKNAENYDIE